MLSREKINELALEAIASVSVKAPGSTRWWLPEHFYQEFARLIIQEVAKANATLVTSPEADVMQGKED